MEWHRRNSMFTGHKVAILLLWKGCGTVQGDADHLCLFLRSARWLRRRSSLKKSHYKALAAFRKVCNGESGDTRKFQATREICTFPAIRRADAGLLTATLAIVVNSHQQIVKRSRLR